MENHKYWISAVEVTQSAINFIHLCGKDSEWTESDIQDLKDELCTDVEFELDPEQVETYVFVPVDSEDLNVIVQQSGNLSSTLLNRIKHATRVKFLNSVADIATS